MKGQADRLGTKNVRATVDLLYKQSCSPFTPASQLWKDLSCHNLYRVDEDSGWP
jgi:hypothetical protein